MSTLICIGLGYCAQHYVAGFGGGWTRIVGTARAADKVAALAARDFGGRAIEVLAFDGAPRSGTPMPCWCRRRPARTVIRC